MTNTLVLDVDGTLVDSQHHIHAAMTEAFGDVGLPAPSLAEVHQVIGLSLPVAMARVRPDVPAEAWTVPFRRVLDAGETQEDVQISGRAPTSPHDDRHWLSSWYPVREGGVIVGVGLFLADITSRVRAERELSATLGREPSDDEIAAHAELPLEQVEEVRDAARTVTSLDRPVGEEGDTALGDLLEGGAPPVDQEVEVSLSEQLLRRTIEDLPETERDVITLRFGLTGDDPQPLRETAVFPPMVVQMIGVGEATGALDTMLGKIADFYEEEVDIAVAGMLTLLEPVMIAFLGGVVGGIVIAMYMPIFGLISQLSGG